jgi:hypothetical protein
MDQYLGGLVMPSLLPAAGASFLVVFLCLCAISRRLSHVLWAIMLAGIAVSVLLFPDRVVSILSIGIAAASLLVLVSGIQANRAHAALQLELSNIEKALATLQGRLVLRLTTQEPPAVAFAPKEIPSPATESKPDHATRQAEHSPPGQVDPAPGRVRVTWCAGP